MRNLPASFDRFRAHAQRLLDNPDLLEISEIDEIIFGKEDAEAVLIQALEQIAAGRGETQGDPLSNLGVEGCWLMLRSMGYGLGSQSAIPAKSKGIIDKMTVCGEDEGGPYEVTFYNLVIHDW